MASSPSPTHKTLRLPAPGSAAIAAPNLQLVRGGSSGAGSGGGRKMSSREEQPLVRVQKQVRACVLCVFTGVGFHQQPKSVDG